MKIIQSKLISSSLIRLLNLPYRTRFIILNIIDLLIIFSSVFISLWLVQVNSQNSFYQQSLLTSITGLGLLNLTGNYVNLTRYTSGIIIYEIIVNSLIIILVSNLISYFIGIEALTIKQVICFCLLFTFFISLVRIFLKQVFSYSINSSKTNTRNVLIYGAGLTGIRLESTFRYSREYNVIAFIDDSKLLQKRKIRGKSIG